MANSVDPDQTAPIGAVCTGSMLFASILNSSVMLGNYLQQMTSADNIFRCIFSWRFKGLKWFDFLLTETCCETGEAETQEAEGWMTALLIWLSKIKKKITLPSSCSREH